MRTLLAILASFSAMACASVERAALSIDDVTHLHADRPVVTTSTPVRASASTASAVEAPTIAPSALASPMRADDGIGQPYTMIRLGAFDPLGDIDDLNTGFWGDLTLGRKFLPFLGIEGSVGYFEAGVPFGDEKLWGIPLFVNARASLPILIFEPFLGAGIGGIYTEYPGNTDWVGAWNAFGGVGVGIGQLAVGVEYRYLQSGDTADDFAIEGQSITAFASLPF